MNTPGVHNEQGLPRSPSHSTSLLPHSCPKESPSPLRRALLSLPASSQPPLCVLFLFWKFYMLESWRWPSKSDFLFEFHLPKAEAYIPLYSWIMFQGRHPLAPLDLFICWSHVGCFYLMAIGDYTTINMHSCALEFLWLMRILCSLTNNKTISHRLRHCLFPPVKAL